MLTDQQIAEKILLPIWNGIDQDYKRRYSISIWSQFESLIRSAAYTDSLKRFLDHICRRARVEIQARDASALAEAVGDTANPAGVLKRLREETSYLVLLVRARREQINAKYRDKQQQTEKQQADKLRSERLGEDRPGEELPF